VFPGEERWRQYMGDFRAGISFIGSFFIVSIGIDTDLYVDGLNNMKQNPHWFVHFVLAAAVNSGYTFPTV
jgi:hypothetical protein